MNPPALGHTVLRLDGRSWLEAPPANEPLRVAALTVEAWLRPDDGTADQGVVALESRAGPLLELHIAGDGCRFGSGHHWVRAPLPAPEPGGWRHLAATCDGHRLRLHLGGATVDGPRAGCALTLTGGALIGTRRAGAGGRLPTAPLRGEVARVRVWERALSLDEAQRSARLEHPPEEAPLADWAMDEGFGATVHNRAGGARRLADARLRGDGGGFRIAIPG